MSEPVISIICNTYNHEKYISQALDSFIMQDVSVPFEILVHDDASTDHTADIIHKYELKYPDLIKPIYQKENQFSQKMSITTTIQIPRAKGKYIAFCEGDDYWTDKYKLQTQYNYMETNLDCTMCCHAYNMVDKTGFLLKEKYDFNKDCEIPMSRLIGNQLEIPQFATLFVRKECINKLKSPFLGKNVNDMVIRVFCATQGKVYYINKNMSCYRRFTEGSWTVKVGQNKDNVIQLHKNNISFIKKLDEYTNGKYRSEIEKCVDRRKFEMFILENEYKEAIKCNAYKRAPTKQKIYVFIGCIFPMLINKMRQ